MLTKGDAEQARKYRELVGKFAALAQHNFPKGNATSVRGLPRDFDEVVVALLADEGFVEPIEPEPGCYAVGFRWPRPNRLANQHIQVLLVAIADYVSSPLGGAARLCEVVGQARQYLDSQPEPEAEF